MHPARAGHPSGKDFSPIPAQATSPDGNDANPDELSKDRAQLVEWAPFSVCL